MPAKRTVSYGTDEELSIEVRPLEDRSIYFVGEDLEFDLYLSNSTPRPISGQIQLFLGFGSGVPDHFRPIDSDFETIPAKGSMSVQTSTDSLPIQGNGVIGIRTPKGDEIVEREWELKARPGSMSGDEYEELYSFTIWDREFYRLHYEEPKELQSSAVRLSKWVVGLVLLQIILVIAQLGVLLYTAFIAT